MNILARETSFDETACAVVNNGTKIISNVVASSATMHEKWGGIVPEVAAREQLKSIIPVIIEALHPYVGGADGKDTAGAQYMGGSKEFNNNDTSTRTINYMKSNKKKMR